MDSEERLRPARPDASAGGARYEPKFPWKRVAAVGVGVLVAVVLWNLQSSSRIHARRDALLATQAQLAPAEERYREFRERIEALVTEAAGTVPTDVADGRLRISELHRGDGLYLRVPLQAASDPEALDAAAKEMEGDAILRCLGIAPTSLRGFFEIGDVLGDAFRERVRSAGSMLVLEALERDLSGRAEQDLAAVRTAMSADYFLLILEHGDRHAGDPVDVFLWNLRGDGDGDERVLEVRARGRGLLVPARIDFPGLDVPRTRPLRQSGIADDCSIASQIKEVTGEQGTDFESGDALDEARESGGASDEGATAPPLPDTASAGEPESSSDAE